MSVNVFIERVSELKIARQFTNSILFRSSMDISTGNALIWFRANMNSFSSWSELMEGLWFEFLAHDYDNRLFEEIKRRTQGTNKSIGMYVHLGHEKFIPSFLYYDFQSRQAQDSA